MKNWEVCLGDLLIETYKFLSYKCKKFIENDEENIDGVGGF